MKKIIAVIALLVVAAGASFGALYAVKNKDKEKTQQEQLASDEMNLLTFNADDVTQVTINCSDGEFIIDRQDDSWVLSNNKDFLVDQDYVTNLCTFCGSLRADSALGDAADEKKNEYGLDSADKITFVTPDGSYSINVGGISPTSEFYYVTKEGSSKVFAVSSLSGSVLKSSRMMIKSKDLVPYSDNEVSGIVIKQGGKTSVDLKKVNDTWTVPDEYSLIPFDITKVDAFIASLTRFEAQRMLEEGLEDKSVYGLDSPDAEVIVSGTDGTTRTLQFTTRRDKTNSYTYVLLKDTDQIEMYYASDMDFCEYTMKNFVTREYTPADMYGITGLELKFNDIDASLDVDMDNSKLSVNGKDIDISENEKSIAFQNFFNSLATLTIRDIDAEAEPENDSPDLTAVFHMKDGTDKTIELVSAGDEDYYVFLNGEYTAVIINGENFTGKNSLTSFYEKLEALT